jgi:hypothetical protein
MRAVSFSGGRTSALMAWLERSRPDFSHDTFRFVFMNTGAEDERTLAFVDRCDREFDLRVVWLEAEVRSGRKSTTHKIVSYQTATRGPRIFEDMARKYGIPNQSYPHCTRELKLRPFESYMRHVAPDGYVRVIGIRSDEKDRISMGSKKFPVDYPLLNGWTKELVRHFWACMPFDLGLPEHRGNCVTCWKKSLRKLMTLATESPEDFDLFAYLEKYAHHGAGDKERRFFRGNRTVADIFREADMGFEKFVDPLELDVLGGCGDSCEIFADGGFE